MLDIRNKELAEVTKADDFIISNKFVSVPHPMISKRNFVLFPLNELIPEFTHPVLKKKISALFIKSRDNSKVNKYS